MEEWYKVGNSCEILTKLEKKLLDVKLCYVIVNNHLVILDQNIWFKLGLLKEALKKVNDLKLLCKQCDKTGIIKLVEELKKVNELIATEKFTQ